MIQICLSKLKYLSVTLRRCPRTCLISATVREFLNARPHFLVGEFRVVLGRGALQPECLRSNPWAVQPYAYSLIFLCLMFLSSVDVILPPPGKRHEGWMNKHEKCWGSAVEEYTHWRWVPTLISLPRASSKCADRKTFIVPFCLYSVGCFYLLHV